MTGKKTCMKIYMQYIPKNFEPIGIHFAWGMHNSTIRKQLLNFEMEAVQPIKKIQGKVRSLKTISEFEEVTVSDVWTKFFFNQKNLLCFQVLLQVDSGEMMLYQELTDYSEYKNTLEDLHKKRSSNAVIKIPKKSTIPVQPLKKWHGFRNV